MFTFIELSRRQSQELCQRQDKAVKCVSEVQSVLVERRDGVEENNHGLKIYRTFAW